MIHPYLPQTEREVLDGLLKYLFLRFDEILKEGKDLEEYCNFAGINKVYDALKPMYRSVKKDEHDIE